MIDTDSMIDEGTARSCVMTFTTYGVAIGIRSNSPELLRLIPERLPPGWEDSSSPRPDAWYSIVRRRVAGARELYELLEDGEKVAQGYRLTPVLDAMDTAIRQRVGAASPDRLFIHAGAVVWNGRAIVLPGRSGAGKTTLVIALVKAGAEYGSDDYAVLDVQGRLHAYARPISCRQGAHRRINLNAERDLGGRRVAAPVPIGLFVHTTYRPAASLELERISPGASAFGLYANVLAARERPAFAFEVLSVAVSGAISVAGDRGDADAAAAAILGYSEQLPSFTQGT